MFRSAKSIVKRSLQYAAANFGLAGGYNREPRLAILMYHRILPKNDPRARLEEPGMMVTPETFAMHMALLKERFDVFSLSQWLKHKHQGDKLPSRSIVITFDDGWADNYEFAFPVLKQYELPATIFLVSDMIGKNDAFWPQRLAHLLSSIAVNCPEKWSEPCLAWLRDDSLSYRFTATPPDQEQLSEIIQRLKILQDEDIHGRIDSAENLLSLTTSSTPSLLSWQQMAEMSASGLVEAGSHTCRHIRLNDSLDEDTMAREIIHSKLQIEKHLGQPVETFCYPNGDHSPAAVELVKQHYQCAVTTRKGWNNVTGDAFLLNRIGLHEDISADKTAFLARLSGWL